MGGLLNGFDGAFDQIVFDDQLDFHFGQKIDDIFGTTVQLGMALLTAKALGFGHGQALKADFVQSFLNFVQLEGLDDRFDLFHETVSLEKRGTSTRCCQPFSMGRATSATAKTLESPYISKLFLPFLLANSPFLGHTDKCIAETMWIHAMTARNSVFAACQGTVFETMSRLAAAHGAVNLGQGFPEGLEPPEMIEALVRISRDGSHQYPPMLGTAALRQAVARHEERFYATPVTADNVMVTSGATAALAACLFGLIEPGDEVVVIEPFYDSYLPIIRRAGGIPLLLRLQPPGWDLDLAQLDALITPRTRLMIINSPGNPSGKVLSAAELDGLAELVCRHNLTVICDEVYEHLTFDGHTHIPLSSRPQMASRCVKIGSAGKIFSLTGWKIGWVVGHADLLAPIIRAHQFLSFSVPPNLQDAVAWGLDHLSSYYLSLPQILSQRRDRLAQGLSALGFIPLPVQGSYFLTLDLSALPMTGDDVQISTDLTVQAGVTGIPVSAFYLDQPPKHLLRFCFAKTETAIENALSRLKTHFLS